MVRYDYRRLGTGVSGLANCGNMCYLNACVQCLVHCPVLGSFMDTGSYRCRLKEGRSGSSLLAALDSIRQLLLHSDHTVVPHAFYCNCPVAGGNCSKE